MFKKRLIVCWFFVLLLSACQHQQERKPEIRLNPEPAVVDYNGSFTMSWEAKDIDYCFATGDWTGNLKSSGSKLLGPLSRDSLYILSCYYDGQEISQSVMVETRAPKIPKVSLSASPSSIGFQHDTTISWTTEHVEECVAVDDWSGKKALSGSLRLEALEHDSEFRLNCNGPQGKVTNSVNVKVYEEEISVPEVSLKAIPATIPYNGSTTLNWSTRHADICRASGKWFGSKDRNGMQTIKQLNQDARFRLSCTIAAENSGEGVDEVLVRVGPAPPPEVNLTASPLKVNFNGTTTLRWSTDHADGCRALGDWSGTKSVSGSLTISGLKKNSVFSLNCSGLGGLGSDSITVSLLDSNS